MACAIPRLPVAGESRFAFVKICVGAVTIGDSNRQEMALVKRQTTFFFLPLDDVTNREGCNLVFDGLSTILQVLSGVTSPSIGR